jgi:uncharacterized caspase-like protein
MASANAAHFALVIGIDDYSSGQYRSLQGACADAAGFYDWLRDPAGGNVPPENIAFFTNPAREASVDPPRSVSVEPTWSSVRRALAEWVSRSQRTQLPIGSRLYIYLAGHGYNHRDRTDDVYLLLTVYPDTSADAFPGTGSGEWFRVRAMFDQILVVMDCCRDREVSVTTTPLALGEAGGIDGREPGDVRFLFSYGTEFGRASREQCFNGGPPQGVFTKALIEGLRGAAVDSSGAVTCSSLTQYLAAQVPKLAPRGNGNQYAQQPDFTPSPVTQEKDFVICKLAAPSVAIPKLRVEVKPPYSEVRVWDGKSFDESTMRYLKGISVNWEKGGSEWVGGVPFGLYVLEWVGAGTDARELAITVRGDCHASP